MWISVGTPLPEFDPETSGLEWLQLDDAGILIAGLLDCRRLACNPTEEQLAEILGYVESKAVALARTLPAAPLAVQARIGGCVVLEMLTSVECFREAAVRCHEHGDVHVMTMEAALHRRERLIAEEERDAQRQQGRPGRAEAKARVPR